MPNKKTAKGTEYRPHMNIQYSPDADPLQKLDVYVPGGTAPTAGRPLVVYVHGGAFKMGDKADPGPSLDYALKALDYGFVMASVNYRLTGSEQVEPEIEDVWAALRWLSANAESYKYRINREKIAFLGASAGAGLASVVAARANKGDGPSVKAVVGISGAYHITKTAEELHPGAPPFYIAHGTKDSALDLSVSEDFCAALKAAGVPYEFAIAEGADHCRADDKPHIYQVLEETGKLDDAWVWLRKIFEG